MATVTDRKSQTVQVPGTGTEVGLVCLALLSPVRLRCGPGSVAPRQLLLLGYLLRVRPAGALRDREGVQSCLHYTFSARVQYRVRVKAVQ